MFEDPKDIFHFNLKFVYKNSTIAYSTSDVCLFEDNDIGWVPTPIMVSMAGYLTNHIWMARLLMTNYVSINTHSSNYAS